MSTQPPNPVHVPGTKKGEELALHKREPGRGENSSSKKNYRSARDATSINPAHHDPILPVMAYLPPA